MTRWALKDADITKLLLCKQGANRHRVFLLKAKGQDDKPVARLAPLFKEAGKDWRTAYVPVAVPGAEEDQGLFPTADDDVDVWDEEEIAKAAHSYMRNGRLLGSEQHFDGKLADGVHLVESAQALADFEVNGHKIAKGTWYVGLQFDDPDLRARVDTKEIDAVSVEGLASRVAKTETFSKPGTADVTPADTEKIRPLAMHYLAMPHPFTTCVRDQEKHGVAPDHAKRRCAVLLDKFDPKRLRHSTQVAKDAGDELDIGDAPWSDEATVAVDALVAAPGSVGDVEDQPPKGFWRRVAKALNFDTEALDEATGTVEDVELGERVDQLEGRLDGLDKKLIGTDEEPGLVAKTAAAVKDLVAKLDDKGGEGSEGTENEGTEGKEPVGKEGGKDDEPTTVTREELDKKLDEVCEKFAGEVEPIAKAIGELSEGTSVQVESEEVAKANGKTSEPATAGIIFD